MRGAPNRLDIAAVLVLIGCVAAIVVGLDTPLNGFWRQDQAVIAPDGDNCPCPPERVSGADGRDENPMPESLIVGNVPSDGGAAPSNQPPAPPTSPRLNESIGDRAERREPELRDDSTTRDENALGVSSVVEKPGPRVSNSETMARLGKVLLRRDGDNPRPALPAQGRPTGNKTTNISSKLLRVITR